MTDTTVVTNENSVIIENNEPHTITFSKSEAKALRDKPAQEPQPKVEAKPVTPVAEKPVVVAEKTNEPGEWVDPDDVVEEPVEVVDTVDVDDEPIVLKSTDPEYLKRKAENEIAKARRIERENKQLREQIAKNQSTPVAPVKEDVVQPISNIPENIPTNIKSRIKDEIDSVIYSDPEMIRLANKESEIKAKQASIKSNSHMYKTNAELISALDDVRDELTEVQQDLQFKHYQGRIAIQQHIEAQQSESYKSEQKIANDYQSKLDSVKEKYPAIEKASEKLSKKAEQLHIEIRKAIVLDPDAAELTWQIANTKGALDLLISSSAAASKNKSVPTDALIYIGKLKAQIESGSTTENTIDTAPVPRAVKSRVVNNTVPSSSEGPIDYRKIAREMINGKRKPSWKK